MSVARVVVVGHVDHGKSTLIGRLLYDLGILDPAKINDVVASSARRGVATEWSYVLDSLQEERDQAVTIDTTRVWFEHGGRRFVLIDAPGHRQFLANMLSGASEADAAILVVDAQAGIEDQTLRHAYLMRFLGITQIIVALNKIDALVDVQSRCAEVEREIRAVLGHTPPVAVVPISGSLGWNVSSRAESTPWYTGPTIADVLLAVREVPAPGERALRLSVQDVFRRDGERFVVGTIASGMMTQGTHARLLPAGGTVTVERLARWPENDIPSAAAGETIAAVLDGDRFVRRGDTIVSVDAPAIVSRELVVEMFWLDAEGPQDGERLRLRRGTQDVPVVVTQTPSIYDIEQGPAGESVPPAQYNLVTLALHAAAPVAFDRRDDDPVGARSVLLRGQRVCAIGFTVEVPLSRGEHDKPVSLLERQERIGHSPAIVWLTGLSGAGKTTIARAVERRLFDRGFAVTVIDGDLLRETLSTDLTFSDADRAENVRRAAVLANFIADSGHVVLVALISPFAQDRARARAHAVHPFYEAFVNAPLETCEQRDPKGLYRRARSNGTTWTTAFTGIGSAYEPPVSPDIELRTAECGVENVVARLSAFVEERTRL
ncbi:MAG: adenylyl-sulfate kinase [Candidatus Velthaea sp.]